jgi:hypothetical protein
MRPPNGATLDAWVQWIAEAGSPTEQHRRLGVAAGKGECPWEIAKKVVNRKTGLLYLVECFRCGGDAWSEQPASSQPCAYCDSCAPEYL